MRRFHVTLVVVTLASLSSAKRPGRAAFPGPAEGETLFRSHVDPEMGGKTPESSRLRSELNRIDSEGLNVRSSQQMVDVLKDMPLPEKASALIPHSGQVSSHSLPLLGQSYRDPVYGHPEPTYGHPAPAYGHPEPAYHEPEPAYGHPSPAYDHPEPAYHEPEPSYGHPKPGYHEPEPAYGHPKPVYHEPEPAYGHPKPGYHKPEATYGHPEPGYGPPKPSYGAPYKPKAPVLLKDKYTPKEVKPVEIVTHEVYTNFDCRGKNYETFYADVEAGCQIYHLCHSNGKQDTFHCPYGTIFNEYIGTCDHLGAAHCHSGEGYHKPDPPPKKPGYHEPPPGYHEPAPYHPAPHHPTPKPYHPKPAPYHPPPAPYHPSPAPYHPTPKPYHPEPYHPEPYHPTPTPYEPPSYSNPEEKAITPFVHF